MESGTNGDTIDDPQNDPEKTEGDLSKLSELSSDRESAGIAFFLIMETMLKYTQQSLSIGPNVVNVLHAKASEYSCLLICHLWDCYLLLIKSFDLFEPHHSSYCYPFCNALPL